MLRLLVLSGVLRASQALNFLANQGPSCENYVSASLVQLVGCVTKLGWNDLEDQQQIVLEVRNAPPPVISLMTAQLLAALGLVFLRHAARTVAR